MSPTSLAKYHAAYLQVVLYRLKTCVRIHFIYTKITKYKDEVDLKIAYLAIYNAYFGSLLFVHYEELGQFVKVIVTLGTVDFKLFLILNHPFVSNFESRCYLTCSTDTVRCDDAYDIFHSFINLDPFLTH